ncbi:MAG: SIS domain-containing protein [Verrucomicrobiota bacterium]
MSSICEEAERFLQVAPQFQLGVLTTEQPHPATRDLSRLARGDLRTGLEVLQRVDLDALGMLGEYAETLRPLSEAIGETVEAGGKIFLCGCGATGRLSISLEVFAREGLFGRRFQEAVVGFMAGGDAALVRSIERFEDYPDYGARQLFELGFRDGDLMIATTEGGETPFVIGAVEEAARVSGRRPFFLYCNPDDRLCRVAERSRRVIENRAIEKVNLTVGPMALTGSTRMQASTVLMAAVGWAMACCEELERLGEKAGEFRDWVEETDWGFLAELVRFEEGVYDVGGGVFYEPNGYGMTVLTDTTERSPTFSLAPFENVWDEGGKRSWCYLHLKGAGDAGEAWRRLLGREPRTLEWGEVVALAGRERLLGFDFSDGYAVRREGVGVHERVVIEDRLEAIEIRAGERSFEVAAAGRDLFSRHLMLKLILNAHSTLLMGRFGRYEGNVMTWVQASNNKLIDRAIRYVRILLEERGDEVPEYEEVARVLFRVRSEMGSDEAVVMKVVEAMEMVEV